MNQNWGIYACIGAFAATFAAGTLFVASQRVAPPAPPAPTPRPAPVPEGEPKPTFAKNPPKGNGVTAWHFPPRGREPYHGVETAEAKAAVVRQWSIGGIAEKQEAHQPTYVRRIYVDPTGVRVVTKTESETACWDLASGARLQTFKNDGKGTYCSPDARVVATLSKNGKQLALNEASTGRTIGTYTPPGGGELIDRDHEPTYTPGGDFLLVCVKDKGKEAIAAVSTRTAVGKIVNLPRDWFDTTGHAWRELMPRPRENRFYRQLIAFPCCAMNLADGINTKVESLTIGPIHEPGSRALKVSADGRYLLARNRSQLRVIDLKADEIALKLNTKVLTGEWFTPDARRFVSLRVPERVYIINGVVGTPEGGWLSVYEVPAGKPPPVEKMTDRPPIVGAEFVMNEAGLKGLADLAFLPDGRRFVMLDRGTTVAVIDFEKAFGVAPLPALPRDTEPEKLPLR